MKHLKKLVVSLMVLLIAVGTFHTTAYAADADLTLETNIDKSLEIPLTLKGDTDTFYTSANINPGDVIKADVVFKNVSGEDIQVRISDVTDQLNTTESAALLEILDLTITTDGSPIYKGSYKNVTSPLTQWITLEAGKSLTMNINVEFPKYEADNQFQGSKMKVKYVFEARADVPLDEEESLESASIESTNAANAETVKTGVDTTESTNPAAIAIICIAVVVVVAFIVTLFVGKKKDDKEDSEKDNE
jgi:hypothetical protein